MTGVVDMKEIPFDRESIAMQILMGSVDQIGMGEILQDSRINGAEAVSKELAVLSFAIADAMIAARGESK